MTLLDNLVKVNGCQGGTIHQYLKVNDLNFDDFCKAYYDFARMNVEFNSKMAFEKLAKQYHVDIKWGDR